MNARAVKHNDELVKLWEIVPTLLVYIIKGKALNVHDRELVMSPDLKVPLFASQMMTSRNSSI